MTSSEGHLSFCCKGCGLHYTETRGVVSPHFALCPRCGRFNEPHTVSDGTSTWIPAQPR